MKLKEKIQEDFIKAMKERNEVAKLALSGIKAMITEAEKLNGNKPIGDQEVLKVLNKAIKNRKASAEEYYKYNRPDLATKELAEVEVLNKYMPTKMESDEVKKIITQIYDSLSSVENINARKGRTMGEFNKKYQGLADIELIKQIINEIK